MPWPNLHFGAGFGGSQSVEEQIFASVLFKNTALDAADLSTLAAELNAFHIGIADGSRSTATISATTVNVGNLVTITVQARDSFGNALAFGDAVVEGEITGANYDTCAVVDNGNGTYTLTYTPVADGVDYIAVRLNGEYIQPAAFIVTVNDAAIVFNAPLEKDITELTGNGTPTFTRATVATMEIDNFLHYYASGVPRFHPARGLFFEGQRTNLLLHSGDLSQSAWNKSASISITATNAIGLSLDAAKANEVTVIAGSRQLYQGGITVTAETDYVFSFYAKKGTATKILPRTYDESNAAFFGSSDHVTLNEQWQRVQIKLTTPVGCTSLRVYLTRDPTETPNEGTWYFEAAQVEARDTQFDDATSYIVTGASTATRNRDELTYAGDWDNLCTDSAGTAYFQFTPIQLTGTPGGIVVVSFRNTVVSNCFFGGTAPPGFFIVHDDVSGQSVAHTMSYLTEKRFATRWNSTLSTKQAFAGGVASTEGSYDGTMQRTPADQVSFGMGGATTIGLWGWVRNAKLYNIDLGATRLLAQTAGS